MALSASVLGPLLQAKIDALSLSDDAQKNRASVFHAMAEAFIEHVTSEGIVTVTVASVTGVTSGAGVSGPGTGTGTIS